MTSRSSITSASRPISTLAEGQTALGVILALGMAAVVGGALAFEHIGGFIPCMLCLQQRLPYYAGIPVAALAALSSALGCPPALTRTLFLIAAALMAAGAALGVYHSCVEWGWWPGPTNCATGSTTGLSTNAGNLLDDLNAMRPPSCSEAAGRFLGLSFAGWNVIAASGLALLALKGAFASRR